MKQLKNLVKIVGKEAKSISLTDIHIHDRSDPWLRTGISIKGGAVILVLRAESSTVSDIRRKLNDQHCYKER